MLDAWIVALGFVASMSAAWWLGWRRGRRLTTVQGEDPSIKFVDGSMALLGLLLAFTFAMALGRHDQRRLAVVAESNAIGDFYTCASLLKEPRRARLQEVIHEYGRLRLDMDRSSMTPEEKAAAVQRCYQLHTKMTEQVADAVQEGTPIAVSLANTLTNLTSAQASTRAAYQETLPWGIVVLLLLSAVAPAFLVGQQQGEATRVHFAGTVCFIFLVGLVMFAILDLNQPTRGFITVNLDSLEQVVHSMAK
jgi:Mg2+/citrate symporter